MKVLAELLRMVEAGETCVMATTVAAQGSTPRKAGARLVLTADGRQVGTVGGGELESVVLTTARALLTGKEATCLLEAPACGGTVTVYLERFAPARQVLVVGAGHVGIAVASGAAAAGYRTTVAAPHAQERLAGTVGVAALATDSPDRLADFPVPEATHVIVATGEQDADVAWALAALAGPFASVGVVGGQKKASVIRERALAQAIRHERAVELRCPVGLAIGAVTPAEIAVSIVAELVMLDRNRDVPVSWRIKS
jgi:xanthine dehydrogenase accessory factor